ncbi:MAG: Ig-like domain-containing protein [Patescibacteria group bacterium]|mgnify:CR=1 FL=1
MNKAREEKLHVGKHCRKVLGNRRISDWKAWSLVFIVASVVGGSIFTTASRNNQFFGAYTAAAYQTPVVSITSPAAWSTVSPSGFCLSGTASDAAGVTEVRVYIYDYGRATYTVYNVKASGTTQWIFQVYSTHITPQNYAYAWVSAKNTHGSWSNWLGRGFYVANASALNASRSGFGTTCSGTAPATFSLLSVASDQPPPPQEPTEGVKLSVDQILGAPTNSGWVYIANTVPDASGITFWASIAKNRENTYLVYGIADTINQTYYSGFLPSGTIATSQEQFYMASYSYQGRQLIKASQLDTAGTLGLEVDLPWPSLANPQRRYALTKNFPLDGYPIWESGDGVIPMTGDFRSWYLSFLFEGKIWLDVQKFNVSEGQSSQPPNHRWGSFILQQPGGGLSARTRGVWWEILDAQGKRQKGGFTNFDLKDIPSSFQQTTKDDFTIIPIETYNSGNKVYLKKWRFVQSDLKIDLLMETNIPNQENKVMGKYFYEGAIKVFHPDGAQIGTGMLEQTHNEAQ